jgi:hypothetical protein
LPILDNGCASAHHSRTDRDFAIVAERFKMEGGY